MFNELMSTIIKLSLDQEFNSFILNDVIYYQRNDN